MSCLVLSCLVLSWLFYSILFYFISNRLDLIWLNSILLNSIYYIVQYCISYQWMICVYLSVCLFICMNKFMFSLLFSFLFYYSFFSHERLPHTYTDTDTQMHMNLCSFLWLVHITTKGRKWRIVFEWYYYLIFDLIR